MTIQTRPPQAASGRRSFVRLMVPVLPDAGPRAILAAQAAFLIDMLDSMDDDPDLEETGDLEPSLGYYYGREPDLELDPSDDEPSLGSFDRMLDQTKWCSSGFVNGVDLELDRAEDEPSLGSPSASIGNQERWAQGINADANGDELDENGDERDLDGDEHDYSGDAPSDDDPIFPSGQKSPAPAEQTRMLNAFARKGTRPRRIYVSGAQP